MKLQTNCETQDDSSDSLIPDKASDSIAESEFPSDTFEKKSISTPAGGTDPDTSHKPDQNQGLSPDSHNS